MDMEFEKLEQVMEDMTINTTAAREHVGDIKRTIQTCKEHCRSVTSELPYKNYMPDQFIIHLIYFVVMWFNAFPADKWSQRSIPPPELVTDTKMDVKKHCTARWGS